MIVNNLKMIKGKGSNSLALRNVIVKYLEKINNNVKVVDKDFWRKYFLRIRNKEDKIVFYSIEAGNEVIGFVTCTLDKEAANITDLYIIDGFANIGIEDIVLDELIDVLWGKGVKNINATLKQPCSFPIEGV